MNVFNLDIHCLIGGCGAICYKGESDLKLLGRKFGLANVTSLVERISRFTVLLVNANRTTSRVMGHLAKVM